MEDTNITLGFDRPNEPALRPKGKNVQLIQFITETLTITFVFLNALLSITVLEILKLNSVLIINSTDFLDAQMLYLQITFQDYAFKFVLSKLI